MYDPNTKQTVTKYLTVYLQYVNGFVCCCGVALAIFLRPVIALEFETSFTVVFTCVLYLLQRLNK